MKPVQKCVVPTCQNKLETASCVDFFTVPSTGHKVFNRWTRLLNLSGERTEKICADHFTKNDFITNTRTKLKQNAIPKLHIPEQSPKIRFGQACCIDGCNSIKEGVLHRFPSDKRLLQKWKTALGVGENSSTRGLAVCEIHFSKLNFTKITSRYLKSSAVPSKKIHPQRALQKLNLPDRSMIDNISVYACKSRSNRICFVNGCRSRKEGNIKLHGFPAQSDVRFKEWIRILKCYKLPTPNSKVCSLHFKDSDYIGGGPRLKPYAIPSAEIRGAQTNSTYETDGDSLSSFESDTPTLDHSEQNELGERPANQSPVPNEPNDVEHTTEDDSNQERIDHVDFEFVAV